jgi:hypothetical protein
MPGQPKRNWMDRAVWQMRTEPKKTCAMAILILVMVGMWGKLAFSGGKSISPSAARADATPAGPAGQIRPPVQPLSRSAEALQEWLNKPVGLVRRNLFAVKLEHFPRDGSALAEEGESFWDEVAKSMGVRADEEKARRILIANLREQALKLDLQSTVMSSDSPKALVNGQLLGEGDMIDGFRIVGIESKRIVVEREGVKFEILFRYKL